MNLRTGAILAFVLFATPSFGDGGNTSPADQVRASNQFAFELYRRLADEPRDMLMSPYSASCALAMVYAGARQRTAEHMARTLHFVLPPEELGAAFQLGRETPIAGAAGDSSSRAVPLRVANAAWFDRRLTLRAAFTGILERDFAAPARAADFHTAPDAARRSINQWVNDRTADRIPELLRPPDIDMTTTLVLVNALYFLGTWKHPFAPAETKEARFAAITGDSTRVDLMRQVASLPYAENDSAQVLELPYADRSYSMLLLLPAAPMSLPALEAALSGDGLARWRRSLGERQVEVFVPRLRLGGRFELPKTLAAMGMPDAFGGEADFSGITGRQGLSISQVVQASWLELDEKGTEAAAATAVETSWGMSGHLYRDGRPVVFRADRPFVLVLLDRSSGAVLFLGRVVDPGRS